jgi:hypothetical protein
LAGRTAGICQNRRSTSVNPNLPGDGKQEIRKIAACEKLFKVCLAAETENLPKPSLVIGKASGSEATENKKFAESSPAKSYLKLVWRRKLKICQNRRSTNGMANLPDDGKQEIRRIVACGKLFKACLATENKNFMEDF